MWTILIIEDHAIVREPLARLLHLEGYRTFAAANGNDALAALEKETIDLVLLDLMMPKKDGVSFLEILRGDPRWNQLPAIVLTGVVEGSLVDRARELTGDEVLFKSRFSMEELLMRIRRRLTARENAA